MEATESAAPTNDQLRKWLWKLVTGSAAEADDAAHHLQQRHLLALSSGEPHRFGEEIRAALDERRSDTPRFIEALLDSRRASHDERVSLVLEDERRRDRIFDRAAELETKQRHRAETWRNRKRAALCIQSDEKNWREARQTELLNQQIVSALVLDELREQWLDAPELARRALHDPKEQRHVAKALTTLGPAGCAFAVDLLDSLEAAQMNFRNDFAAPLAEMIRDNPTCFQRVVEIFFSGGEEAMWNAAYTLHHLGPAAMSRDTDLVPRLLGATRSAGRQHAAVFTLGEVARGREEVVDVLLQISSDADMQTRGAALTALGRVRCQPERVVARLIAAFDDYKEEDPDEIYYSQHSRVTQALQAFGPAAAPAIPVLLRHLKDSDGGVDRGVVETLGTIGSAAAGALPVLETLLPHEDERCEDDPPTIAINRIRAG